MKVCVGRECKVNERDKQRERQEQRKEMIKMGEEIEEIIMKGTIERKIVIWKRERIGKKSGN